MGEPGETEPTRFTEEGYSRAAQDMIRVPGYGYPMTLGGQRRMLQAVQEQRKEFASVLPLELRSAIKGWLAYYEASARRQIQRSEDWERRGEESKAIRRNVRM